jgi:hypothetical protein
LKRSAIGIDVDPIACLIAKVLSITYNHDDIQIFSESVQNHLKRIVKDLKTMDISSFKSGVIITIDGRAVTIPTDDNISFWFAPIQQAILASLVKMSTLYENADQKDIINLAISASIIHKWPSTISLAKDIDHSRPHRVIRNDLSIESQIAIFDSSFRRIIRYLKKLDALSDIKSTSFEIIHGNLNEVITQIKTDSIDYVVTSPPYFNAIDYPRSHKFSQWWLWPYADKLVNENYIGLKSGNKLTTKPEPNSLLIPKTSKLLDDLRTKHPTDYHNFCRYINDMGEAVNGIYKVVKPGKHVSFVLSNNIVKGIPIPVTSIIGEILDNSNFRVIEIRERKLDSNRRRYPFGITGFHGLMDSEFIINAVSKKT